MRKSSVSRLPLKSPLPFAVYHDSGRKLHDFDEELTDRHTFLMQRAGMTEVWLADRLDRPARVAEDLKAREVEKLDTARGATLARPVYSEDGQLLVEAGGRVTEDILSFLTKTGVKKICVVKRDSELNLDQVTKYKKDLEKYIATGEPIPGMEAQGGAGHLLQLARDLQIVHEIEAKAQGFLRVPPSKEPLSRRLPALDPAKFRTREELDALRTMYNSCVARIEGIFRDLAAGKKVELKAIDVLIADMLKATLRDRSLLLAIMHQPREGEYLFNHAVNVFTLVVNLAITLDYDEKVLKEVCYAALFNDVGMMLVPDSIRTKAGKLTEGENAEVKNHTTYSVRLARQVDGLPEMVPMIIFQGHEFTDGSGYPRQRKAEDIHDLAKVVAVADTYSAMISNRPYRRGEKPYKALEELIKLSGMRKYDARAVRALLQCVNLFPVGSWVRMADASIGVVVCPNLSEFARPHVRLIFDRMGKPVTGFPLVSTADISGAAIDRAIDAPQGISALLAFFRPG